MKTQKYKVWEDDKIIFTGTSGEIVSFLHLNRKEYVSVACTQNKIIKNKYQITRIDEDLKRDYKIIFNGKEYVGSLTKISNDSGLTRIMVRKYLNVHSKYKNIKKDKPKEKKENVIDTYIRLLNLPPYYKTILGKNANTQKIIEELKNRGIEVNCYPKKDNLGKYYVLEMVR